MRVPPLASACQCRVFTMYALNPLASDCACKRCKARGALQGKYLEQIAELYAEVRARRVFVGCVLFLSPHLLFSFLCWV